MARKYLKFTVHNKSEKNSTYIEMSSDDEEVDCHSLLMRMMHILHPACTEKMYWIGK